MGFLFVDGKLGLCYAPAWGLGAVSIKLVSRHERIGYFNASERICPPRRPARRASLAAGIARGDSRSPRVVPIAEAIAGARGGGRSRGGGIRAVRAPRLRGLDASGRSARSALATGVARRRRTGRGARLCRRSGRRRRSHPPCRLASEIPGSGLDGNNWGLRRPLPLLLPPPLSLLRGSALAGRMGAGPQASGRRRIDRRSAAQ